MAEKKKEGTVGKTEGIIVIILAVVSFVLGLLAQQSKRALFMRKESNLIKISAVCGMGLGSGLLVKMGIERVLERHGFGRNDFRVEVADISTARATTPDMFVTTSEFAKSLREVDAEVITVKNLFDEGEIEEAIMDTFKRLHESKTK